MNSRIVKYSKSFAMLMWIFNEVLLHENLNGATLRKSCLALNQEFIQKLACYFFLRWAHFAFKCNEWTQQQFFCPNWLRKVKIYWTASLFFSSYCSNLTTSRNEENPITKDIYFFQSERQNSNLIQFSSLKNMSFLT